MVGHLNHPQPFYLWYNDVTNKMRKCDGMNKREKEYSDVLEDLYDLVLDPSIHDYEREPLLKAKNELEKNSYFPKVMANLEFDLRPYAIQSKLSEPVGKFYMKASTKGRFDRELGKGLAATPITFGNIL